MQQSIHQQLITFGVQAKFLYLGVERLSPARAEEVHAWGVSLTRGTGPSQVELKDRYRSTANEYQAIKAGETTVTEEYVTDLVERVEGVLENGLLDYEEWLTLRGVCFGVTIEDTPANQGFWRDRFRHDVHCTRQLTRILGGNERLHEFLSTLIR